MTNEKYYQMMSQAFYTFLESFSHDSEWHRFLKKFKPVNYTPVEVELPGKEHSWQYRGLFECYFRVKEIPGWRFGVLLVRTKPSSVYFSYISLPIIAVLVCTRF